jgi:hypothetical protein
MNLTDHLRQKQTVLATRWRDVVFDSYPPETRRFFHKEKDRFQNPMAHRLSQGIEGLYRAVHQNLEVEQVKELLDEVISITALKNFSPAQALAFIFLLKGLIREELAAELRDEELARQCLELEGRIDGLALLAFEVYMQRREKLYEIRINEVKAQVSGFLRKSGLSLD